MRTSSLKSIIVCSLIATCMQASAGGLSYVLEDYQRGRYDGKMTTLGLR